MLRSQSRVKKSWIRTKKIRPTLSEKKWSLHCLKEVGSTLLKKKSRIQISDFHFKQCRSNLLHNTDPTFCSNTEWKESRVCTVWKEVGSARFEKKVGSGYPTFISNSADPTFLYTIRIRLSSQTVRIQISFKTVSVVDPDPDPLDPYSEAFWIRIRMWNTDPDPHM